MELQKVTFVSLESVLKNRVRIIYGCALYTGKYGSFNTCLFTYMYLLTYLHLLIYLFTYLNTYLLTYLPAHLPTYLSVPNYLPTYLHVPTFLTYLPTYLPTYRPTYLGPWLLVKHRPSTTLLYYYFSYGNFPIGTSHLEGH